MFIDIMLDKKNLIPCLKKRKMLQVLLKTYAVLLNVILRGTNGDIFGKRIILYSFLSFVKKQNKKTICVTLSLFSCLSLSFFFF